MSKEPVSLYQLPLTTIARRLRDHGCDPFTIDKILDLVIDCRRGLAEELGDDWPLMVASWLRPAA
jgi:hypothetical protein